MTRDELYDILRFISSPTESLELIWGQPFDGETEKITKKDEGDDHETTNRKLENLFDQVKELQEIKQNQEAVELQMAQQIDRLKAALEAMNDYYREHKISGVLYKQVQKALSSDGGESFPRTLGLWKDEQ